MEDLLFFLLFIAIVGINLAARNKGLLKKLSDAGNFGQSKTIPTIHKKVRSRQKQQNRQSPQVKARLVEQNSKKSLNQSLKELERMYSPAPKKQIFSSIKTDETLKNVKNSTETKFKFNSETLKEAVILKEILDAPLALR